MPEEGQRDAQVDDEDRSGEHRSNARSSKDSERRDRRAANTVASYSRYGGLLNSKYYKKQQHQ